MTQLAPQPGPSRYRGGVGKWVGGFDDELEGVLEECAREAGEDVGRYVERAVAAQMLADVQSRTGDVEELTARLAANGLAMDPIAEFAAVINDPDRLRAVYATGLLDSPPEELYDRITRAATVALDAPFSAMSLIDVDRLYLKSEIGVVGGAVDDKAAPLERSLCLYAVGTGAPLILEDARHDPMFKDHPVVYDGSVVAYLGIPLTDQEQNAVGALCVFDTKPRLWTTGHIQVLSDLAAIAESRMFHDQESAQTS